MSERSQQTGARTGSILLVGVAIALAYWFGEGLLHFLLFESGNFRDMLLPSNIPELCMRAFIFCIVIGFSVYSQSLVSKLYEATGRYKALFDNAPDAVFIADSESGLITDANPAAAKLLLRPQNETIGLHYSKLNPPAKQDDATRIFTAQVEDTEKGEESRPIEHVILRSDGVEVPVEIIAKTVDLGNRSMLQGIFRDITQRKGVEEELRQSEGRFRAIFDNMADGVLLADIETKQFYMGNTMICEMLGYDQEELKNLGVKDIHPQQELAFVIAKFDKQAKKQLDLAQDIPIRRRDGSILYADINAFPIKMNGRTYLAGVFRDVTARRIAEERLRRSEERYRSVVEDSPGLVCSFLRDGEITFVNAAYCKYFGKTSDELVGRKFLSLIPEQERQTVLGNILSLNADSPLMSHEHRVVAPGGQLRWHRWTNRAIFDDLGEVVCFQSFGEDITEARKTREALRESEERYRTLVESAGTAIAAINGDGVFLFMNKIGAERLGGKPEDLIGRTMWDVFPKDIADRQMRSVRQVMNTGIGITVTSLTTVQGESRWYSTILEPLKNGNGEAISVMVIARDIHEQKQAEDKLEMYRQEMAQMEHLASLGTLSATAAHEITQPLTVIQLSLQDAIDELTQTSFTDTVKTNLQDSLDEACTIRSIVDRFRSFARRSSKSTIEEVDLRAVAKKIIDLLDAVGARKGVTFQIEGMDGLPHVQSDEKDLEQLFFALIDNAVQQVNDQRNRKVVVSGAVTDDHIELRFSDNCGGIAPENLDRIFEPFFTTKPEGEGTGLGLCVAQDILARIRGKICVESTYGEGSTFIVTIPIDRDLKS